MSQTLLLKRSLKHMKPSVLRHAVFRLKPHILLFSMLTMSSPNVLGQTKCVDAKGRVTYSDVPCAATSAQKPMNLGGTGEQTPQVGGGNMESSPELDKLAREQKRLEWILKGAESEMRVSGSNDAARKVSLAKDDLIRVQERILQITNPAAYQKYLKEKQERLREQQLVEMRRSVNEANDRAAAAEQSAAAAKQSAQRAAARSAAAEDAAQRAAEQAAERPAHHAQPNRPLNCYERPGGRITCN